MKNKLIIEPNKTKKVGLLTYHHTTNFGSLLQTFALYKTITEIGYPCEIIDYRNEAVEQREFIKKLYQCRSLREIKHHLQYSKYGVVLLLLRDSFLCMNAKRMMGRIMSR